MYRSLILGFALAASLATAAPWNKLNPFKGKKAAPARTTAVSTEATPTHATGKKAGKAGKQKEQKPRDYSGIYTSGTVAAIPKQTAGRLDLNNAEVLTFHYGKPSWSIAYRRIKNVEVADKSLDALIRIPKVNERRRTFTIEFFGPSDDLQFTTFEIPLKDSFEVLPLIEQRTGKAVAVSGAQTPGAWWGDGIWKTTRNAALWEEAAGQTKTTVAQKD